jgi:hypothetical protein
LNRALSGFGGADAHRLPFIDRLDVTDVATLSAANFASRLTGTPTPFPAVGGWGHVFVINNEAYIGGGTDNVANTNNNRDIYKFNKTTFGGSLVVIDDAASAVIENVIMRSAYSNGGRGYIVGGMAQTLVGGSEIGLDGANTFSTVYSIDPNAPFPTWRAEPSFPSSQAGFSGTRPWASPMVQANNKFYLVGSDFITGGAIFSYEAGSLVVAAHFSGLTYAARTADETGALTSLETRATAGSVLTGYGQTLIQNMLGGSRLSIHATQDAAFGKIKDQIVQDFKEEVLPRLKYQMNQLGRFGGSVHHVLQAKAADEVMKKLIQVANSIYADVYSRERALQLSAVSLGIDYGTQDVKDAELLRGVGMLHREFEQGQMDDAYKRWHDTITRSHRSVEVLGNAVRTMIGSFYERKTSYYLPSKMSQAAGLALTIAGTVGSIYAANKKPELVPPTTIKDTVGANANIAVASSQTGNSSSDPMYRFDDF